MKYTLKHAQGFTLIEILLVMGIIAILATVVLVAINPARQFAQARDTQRVSHINTILNAVGERTADHRGIFEEECAAGPIPTVATAIRSVGGYDLHDCVVPIYVSTLPSDPRSGSYSSSVDYSTGYTIVRDSVTGRITVSAPDAEVASGTMSVSR